MDKHFSPVGTQIMNAVGALVQPSDLTRWLAQGVYLVITYTPPQQLYDRLWIKSFCAFVHLHSASFFPNQNNSNEDPIPLHSILCKIGRATKGPLQRLESTVPEMLKTSAQSVPENTLNFNVNFSAIKLTLLSWQNITKIPSDTMNGLGLVVSIKKYLVCCLNNILHALHSLTNKLRSAVNE